MIKTAIVPGSEVKYGHLTCVVLEDFEDSLLVPVSYTHLPPLVRKLYGLSHQLHVAKVDSVERTQGIYHGCDRRFL